jgi:methylmalonyl-CoA mutase
LEKEELIQVLQIDNQQVRHQQIEKIKKVKQQRDQSKVSFFLKSLLDQVFV